jgi:hypothetical protein
MAHGALVGNALYFNYDLHTRNLEYDLGRQQLSVIDVPSEFHVGYFALMETEEGGLGSAAIQNSILSVVERGWHQQICRMGAMTSH